VVILDDYQDAARRLDCFKLAGDWTVTVYRDTSKNPADLVERLDGADAAVLIRERTVLTEEVISQLKRLKLLSQTGGSAASIDVGACTRQGIAVACAPGGSADYAWPASHASAEFAWALILNAMRRVTSQARALREGRWQTEVGTTVRGRVLGLLGYGKIGAEVARIGHALGMRALVWGREGSRERATKDGFDVAASQRDLFARADVLTLQMALNPETRGIVATQDLLAMKPTALFVNTSRAGLVQPGALAEALAAGRPGFAAVDVYEEEPLLDVRSNPLVGMDNVLCTPHIAFVEKDSYEASFRNAFEQVRRFFAGDPIRILNPDASAIRAAQAR
jgi:D-3-phosphoglycerate dehydrogenase